MKIYIWTYHSYGRCSYFVLANSRKEAEIAVRKYVKEDDPAAPLDSGEYTVGVREVGEVFGFYHS